MIKWLDLLEESQDMVSIQLADYQQKLTWGYNRNVMPREFVAGDLVLQRAVGKLAPNWEGPYQVTAVAGTEAYYLEDMEERPLPRPWNVSNMKKYYH